MPQNYPSIANAQNFLNDFAINNENPAVVYAGTETSALYYEDREVGGTKYYNVQNATFNKVAQTWLPIDITKPAYAMALTPSGTTEFLTAAAGVSPIAAWTVVYSIAASGAASLALGAVYSVKYYGAKGDGSTDDTAAIQSAINAAQAAGGGVVFFPDGTYVITGTLNITASNIELAGATSGASVISAGANAAFTGISVKGTDNGNGRIYHVTIRDLTLQQTAPPSTSNTAIFGEYVVLLKLRDVIISQWGTGVDIVGTTDFYAERVYITTANATAANVYGFFIDGTTQNASVFLSHCISAHGAYAGIGHSYSYYVVNGDISDLYLHFCESDSSHYGLFVSPSGTGFNVLDIHLYQFVADQHTVNCIYLANLVTDSGMLRISGGWMSPGSSTMTCLIANSCSGLVIDGLQVYGLAARTGVTAIQLTNCDSSSITNNTVKNIENAIAVTGGSLISIEGNNLYATEALAGSAINSSSPRCSIVGNKIGGISNGWANGIYLAAGADYCAVSANTLDPASISSAVVHNDTGNPHTMITNNPGYNPLGSAVAQPSIGTSPWTYTNNTGVLVYLCVSGGTVSSVTVGGTTTGATAGMFAVSPGQNAVITYSVAPTVAALGA